MPQAARSLNVLVVGAGLGGLAAGLALQTDGHKVTIIDSAPEFAEVCMTRSTTSPQPYPLPLDLEHMMMSTELNLVF
jgi:cation diffusion facilitator CzcD-associated flavoprotein CzcO